MKLKIKNTQWTKDKVSFSIAWKEAWNNAVNNDGVYVFVKYKEKGVWHHANLAKSSGKVFDATNAIPEGFSTGSDKDLAMWIPDTAKGAFLFVQKGIEKDVCADNVTFSIKIDEDADIEDMKVFGLEMTYIPEGEFEIGDPMGTNGPRNCLYVYPNGGAYKVVSEDAIIMDAKDGYLYCDQDNERSRDEVPFTIPVSFPKGFKAFWYMKYGVSCQQYVDFLNTLTRRQQQQHVRSDISGSNIPNYYVMTDTCEERFRQSIVVERKGNSTTEPLTFYTYAPARACNAIAWKDTAAFACWAGLRPISDFEFEKACRGPLPSVPWECAWGSTEIGRVDTFSGADGSGDEIKVPTHGLVNACVGSGIAPFEAAAGKTVPDNPGFEGPVTCGLFSFTRHEGIPKRLNDGAGYYGNTELSGNLWEPVVTFGHPKGRAFIPNHGTGELDADGLAQVEGWPDENAEGTGVRGGVYRSPDATYLCVSLRFAGCHAKKEPRFNGGIRVGF